MDALEGFFLKGVCVCGEDSLYWRSRFEDEKVPFKRTIAGFTPDFRHPELPLFFFQGVEIFESTELCNCHLREWKGCHKVSS